VYQDIELLSNKDFEKIIDEKSKQSQEDLEILLRNVKKEFPNPRHNYDVISAYNTLIDEIDLIIGGKNIDIIVMGTKGETNDKKLIFGSQTLQVLKYVSCPVLSIPSGYKYVPPKQVVFPTNYMIPYKRRELKLLCEMVSPFRSNIDLLYVSSIVKLSHRQEDNRLFLEGELCKNTLNFKTIDNKNIAETIFAYTKEKEINLLVMVNTRHSFLEDVLFQSTVDKLSLNINIPFLVMQNIRR
jgi:nucleotide-binding universal stress UspA family protein